ncbi:MAG: GntR family transcriptional regulator [Actinomycetes bacterium]
MVDEPGRTESVGPVARDALARLREMLSGPGVIAGARLGAERDLASELGVSRSALRTALGVLEDEGRVRRVAGRSGGVYVTDSKVELDLSQIVGIPALLREQGFTVGSRLVSVAVVPADERAREALQLERGAYVVDLVRIRLADGTPISLEHARIPADRAPGLIERELGGSLYELLDREYNLPPHEAIERIEVMSAGRDEATILGVRAGDPLLSVTRTTVDAQGVPFEYSHDRFRADRTRVVVRSPGSRDAAGVSRITGRVLELRTRGA